MKITTFIASPRKKGNSTIIADHFIKGVSKWENEQKVVRLADLNINPCRGCGYCDKNLTCIIKDDDMKKMYPLVGNSDVITFITPVYFASMPAQFKAFIDRFQPYYAAKYLFKQPVIPKENNKKVVLFVVSGYERNSFYENIKGIIDIFCLNMNLEFYNGFYYGKIDHPGDVSKRPETLTEIEHFGNQLKELSI